MESGSNPMVEAVVQVGDAATPYLRCGRGARVVVVALDAADRLRLVAALAPMHCVIAPVPPGQATSPLEVAELAGWLRGVLDGLGLQDAEIVVGVEASSLAAALRRSGDERVRILRPGGR